MVPGSNSVEPTENQEVMTDNGCNPFVARFLQAKGIGLFIICRDLVLGRV